MPSLQGMVATSDINLTGPVALPDEKHVWLTDASHAIEALATRYRRTGMPFTADDVRAMIGEPAHGNWFGIAFAAARNHRVIEAVAFGTARAKSRNGGTLKIWRAAE